jgi:hypothetical protein
MDSPMPEPALAARGAAVIAGATAPWSTGCLKSQSSRDLFAALPGVGVPPAGTAGVPIQG